MPRISIEFDTNAKSVAKQVKDLENVLDDITRRGSTRRRAVSTQSRTAIANVAEEINRPDRTRPGSQNVIRAATQAGLGTQLEQSAINAGALLGGVLGKELQQGIGYIVNENMRPIKQAITRLREQAAANAANPAIAQGLEQMADDLQTQLTAYQTMAVSRKSALQALAEPKVLENLEKVRAQYSRLGLDVGSIGDLGKFSARLATISPGLSGAISTLTANVDVLDPQEYTRQFQRIATEGLKQVDAQKKELEAAIKRQTQRSDRRVGTSFTRVFEERFGKIADFLSGAATFDANALPNQMAMSVFREQIKSTAPRRIMQGLDARNISEIQALTDARAGGDAATIATAMASAEKAIQRRINATQEELTKLTKIAQVTGDSDLRAAIAQLRVTVKEAQQKLLNQVNGAQRTIQNSMFDTMDSSLKQFKQITAASKGSKVANFTKDWLVDYNNNLTNSIGNLLQAQNKAFANIRFESLGGKSLADLFPGKGGGVGARANVLTQSLLAPAGFFKATTAEERMNAVAQAATQIVPVLKSLGFSGKELDMAAEQLGDVLAAVNSAYKPVLASVQKLNAEQFEAARARANRLIAQGDFAGARAAIADMDPYATTAVPVSRRGLFTSTAQVSATAPGQIPEFSATNYQQNLDIIEGNIARAEARAENQGGLFRRLGQFAGRALSIFGGLQFAIGGTAQAIGALVEQANRLDRAAATVNALSGSFQGFSRVLALAATQQQKFGGTLEENLQGFNSLIPISKRYGADLLQLDNIARRLAVIDPLQGFQGASIALKEFFSGDITSLSRRFEIDRKTLNSIKAAGTQLQQLQKLDEVLAELGISNAVLEARTQTTAATYDRFGATLSNFTTLVGKGLQTGFAGLTEALTETIDFTDALSRELSDEQAYINLVTNIERVARKLTELQTVTEEVGNPFEKYAGDFVDFNAIVDNNVKSVSELVDEWNGLIIELNRLRGEEGKPLLRLFSDTDYQAIQDLVEISNTTGIPIARLLENRDPITGQMITTQTAAQQAASQVGVVDQLLQSLLLGFETDAVRRRREAEDLAGIRGQSGFLADLLRGPLDIRQLTEPRYLLGRYFSNTVTTQRQGERGMFLENQTGQLTQNLAQVAPAYLEQLRSQTQALNTNTQFYQEQARVLEEQTGINYVETIAEYADQLQFGVLTQEEANNAVLEIIRLNKKLAEVTQTRTQFESDYITKNLQPISGFGGQSLNETLVNQINDIVKQNADVALQILSQGYMAMGGGPSARGMSGELQNLVQVAQEMFGITREQLYYQSQLEKRQARITLETGKSVSAYTALRNQLSGMQVPLQEAVRLAMEFNDGIQGMVSGTMLGQLGLNERMGFLQSEFTNPRAMQNQGDVLGNLDSLLSAILESEQERLDLAAEEKKLAQETAEKTAENEEKRLDLIDDYEKDRAKLLRDYEEKKVDLLEKFEDKKTKLVEDFEKRKLQAIKDGQLQAKENRTDFFSSLFGAETLTPEERAGFTAEYEALVKEAEKLRGEGSFTAAEQVLSSGLELLSNQISLLDQLKSSQNELLDLNTQLSELAGPGSSDIFGTGGDSKEREKLAEESKNLQDEIARLEKRIADLRVLQTLQYDEDQTRLEQARALRDQEKKDFKDMLDEMNDDYRNSLKEMDEDYTQSLTDREQEYRDSLQELEDDFVKSQEKQKQANIEAEKAQILSFEDMMKFRQAGYLALEAARLASEGADRDTIQRELSAGLSSIKGYFSQRNTPASKAILDALSAIEALPPGIQQTFNPALASALGANTATNPYLEEMLRAGVNPQSLTSASAIAPFEAAMVDNTGKIVLNTEAISKSTEATHRLASAIERRGTSALLRAL